MTEAEVQGGLAGVLAELRGRSRSGIGAGWSRVRAGFPIAAQAGLGAGIAWYVARDLLGSPSPFFAPIAAVITLASSVGQRARRTVELVVGVAIGIGVGDGIILLIGTGPWQVGLVVLLAIGAAAAVGGGTPLVVQSASSAVLVATLTTPNSGLPYTRFFDALEGYAEESAGRDFVQPAGSALTVAGSNEPVRVVDVAASDAERFQGTRDHAQVLEVLWRVEKDWHGVKHTSPNRPRPRR